MGIKRRHMRGDKSFNWTSRGRRGSSGNNGGTTGRKTYGKSLGTARGMDYWAKIGREKFGQKKIGQERIGQEQIRREKIGRTRTRRSVCEQPEADAFFGRRAERKEFRRPRLGEQPGRPALFFGTLPRAGCRDGGAGRRA